MPITGFRVEQRRGISFVNLEVQETPVISLKNYVSLINGLIEEGQREDTGVVVLSGLPGKFFFGMDLSEIERLDTKSKTRGATAMVQDLLTELETVPAVLLSAVDGPCFGGGLELILTFHMILATPRCKFGLPEIKAGTIPSYGGTQRLPRIIGRNRALKMLVTGEPIDSETAYAWGLVTEIVEQELLASRVNEIAEHIGNLSRFAVQGLLSSVVKGLDLPMGSALNLESMNSSRLAEGEDLKEGIRAFFEKRAHRFPSTEISSEGRH